MYVLLNVCLFEYDANVLLLIVPVVKLSNDSHIR